MIKEFGIRLATLLIVATVWCPAASYALSMTTAAYYIPSTYTNSAKANTNVGGFYGFFGQAQHALEIEFDQITLASTGAAVQHNYLGIYTYYMPTSAYKIGYLRINTPTDFANIVLVGGKWDTYNSYGYKDWSAGLDVYTSFYNLPTGQPLLIQGVPSYTKYFQAFGLPGSFEFNPKLNIEYNLGQRRFYNNAELAMKYYMNPAWTFGVRYWTGESVYGVSNGGFVVNNSDDVVKQGYAINATYAITPQLSMVLSYQSNTMSNSAILGDFSQNKIAYMLMYNW